MALQAEFAVLGEPFCFLHQMLWCCLCLQPFLPVFISPSVSHSAPGVFCFADVPPAPCELCYSQHGEVWQRSRGFLDEQEMRILTPHSEGLIYYLTFNIYIYI